MDEQLDNELKKRIQQVFENLDDTTADEGWLLLREKFPEKESKRRGLIWLWWGSAAAILFIFLGIGLWYFNKNEANNPVKQFTVQPAKHSQAPTVIAPKKVVSDTGINGRSATKGQPQLANTSNNKKNISKDTFRAIKQTQQQIAVTTKKTGNDSAKYVHSANGQEQSQVANASNKKSNKGKSSILPVIQNQQQIAGIQTTKIDTINKKTNTVTDSKSHSSNSGLIVKNSPPVQQTKVNPGKQNKADPDKKNPSANLAITGDKTTQESLAANNETDDVAKPVNKTAQSQISATAKVDTTSAKKIAATPKPVKKTIEDMFAEDKQITPKKKKDDKKSDDKLVHFGVYAATYFSYAKGSDDEVNVGGGFSSDIKINNNLKLVTGVAIGQNTLSYPGASAANSSSSSSSYFAAAANTAVPAAYANYAQVATPSVKNYNASLVGLDIPLNLKYQINPQKSDTYILAGVSSGTFINESYTYFYNYPAVSSVTLQQTQGATTSKSFDGFYFAKTLNLAFGMGYPLGNNRLIIEPFLKYPLEGLGSEQIRFGAGGINLKFNFSSKK